MKFGVYAIRDSKSGFMTPTFEPNDAVAMRNFTHAVLNSSSVLTSHAEDFTLFKIADFDSDTGHITPFELVVELMNGASVR